MGYWNLITYRMKKKSKKDIYFWAKAILAGMSTNIKINVIWNWISHLEEKSIDSVIFTKCVIRF